MSNNSIHIDTEISNAEEYDSMDTSSASKDDFSPRIRLPIETGPEIPDVDELLMNFEFCSIEDVKNRVFIYDIGDITRLPNDQVSKYYEMCVDVTHATPYELLDSVLRCANFNDPYEIQQGSVANIEDAIDNGTDMMRRVAPKYDALRQIYNGYLDWFRVNGTNIEHELIKNFEGATSEQKSKLTGTAVELINIFGELWAKKCLELVANEAKESHINHANVVICGEGVVYGAAQLLTIGYSSAIPIENIYSTTNASKTALLERIQRRFGETCKLLVVTSVPETVTAAESLQIPVWPVRDDDDYKLLEVLQKNHWLK